MLGKERILIRASKTGNVYVMKLLLDAGADPDPVGAYYPPIYFASCGGHAEIVKLLIEAGASANHSKGRNSDSAPLIAASTYRRANVAKLLLDAGADPTVANTFKQTPLYVASMNGSFETVKMLLSVGNGADLNICNHSGQSPLLVATLGGHEEIVKLLLDAGADPTIANYHGMTPLSQALQMNDSLIVSLLENWPRVVPLRTLCLRTILTKKHGGVKVPQWVPPVLLEWPSIEEVTGISSERSAKRQKR